jgi:hypothetical protein
MALRPMEIPLRADLWMDRFCFEMRRLGATAAPERIVELAWERQAIDGLIEPEVAAQAEWKIGTPHMH